MRYTLDEYHRILADASYTAAICKITGEPETFKCNTTSCAFCPFAHGVRMCWTQKRTADEWDKWISAFSTDNDPDRPYTVEIPADVIDVIDTALHSETLDSDTRSLLRLIKKQIIDDENRN